jgi:Ca2+-binding EF-hand superfamily protein
VFDKDGDGTITAKEVQAVLTALGQTMDRETIDLMIKSVDTVLILNSCHVMLPLLMLY